MASPQQLQAEYYSRTAGDYDAMHVGAADEHVIALRYIRCFLEPIGAKSLLDVGAGTGRVYRQLKETGIQVRGVEPVQALIDEAISHHGVPPGVIEQGRGEALPFADGSFDVVCSFAVLHHVPNPAAVVREMCRVARKAVFISDGNRFAQGRRPTRWLKLTLAAMGCWPLVNWVKTGGKKYSYSEGDGIYYSFSLYDTQKVLAGWARRLFYVPLDHEPATSWMHPLNTSQFVLACAFREEPGASQGISVSANNGS
jgi:2-polyprenyl-3-methyl-5-hydroxy-6-metoxy-1,4-benzoquinol methylase